MKKEKQNIEEVKQDRDEEVMKSRSQRDTKEIERVIMA